jgi:hypothetical protein
MTERMAMAEVDLAERAAAIAVSARARVESDRERNRRDMPEATRLMDELTATFGKPQWCRWTEAGRTVEWGKPLQYSYAVQASVGPKRKERKR